MTWTTNTFTDTTYDPASGSIASIATPEGTIHYEYDPKTGEHLRTYTDSNDSTYGYDTLGRLTTVTVTKLNGVTLSTSQVTSYTYDADGNLKTVTQPDGLTTTYTYDSLNRLHLEVVDDSSGNLVASYDYHVRPDGLRDTVDEKQKNIDGSTTDTFITYTYDNDGRLTSEEHDVGNNGPDAEDEKITYAFDLANNRTGEAIDLGDDGTVDEAVTYLYNGNDELLSETSTIPANDKSYTYDNNGSTTSITSGAPGSTQTEKYVWDLRNRMVGLDANGDGDLSDAGDTIYTYDTSGVRESEVIVSEAAMYYLNTEQGAVYVFAEPVSGWTNMTQTAKLTASDGAAGNYFGTSVSIIDNTVVVGAAGVRVGENSSQGAAYIFTESGSVWTQTAKLIASDGAMFDNFGSSVSIINNTVVIGAFEATVSGNSLQGAAYVFETAALVLATSSGSATYTPGTPAIAIDPGLTLTDDGSPTINSATIQITQNYVAGEDVLVFANQNGISGSFANGTLTLSGTATVAQYQAALRSVTYADIGSNPSTLTRTISFTVTDANNNTSNTATRNVDVVLQFGVVGSGKNVVLKLTDTNGTQATFALKGGGTAEVIPGTGEDGQEFFDLNVTDTTAKSNLTITSKKNTGTGTITLHNVTIGGTVPVIGSFTPAIASTLTQPQAAAADSGDVSLKSFIATNAEVTGTFEVHGSIGTITIHQISQGVIKIDPTDLPIAPLVLNIPLDIEDSSIDSAIPIKSLTTVAWTDDDTTPDFLKAPSIGIITTGNKKAGFTGDFQADIAGEDAADGNPTSTTLGSAKIAGTVSNSNWMIQGAIKSISVGAFADTWSATLGTVKSITTTMGNLSGHLTAASLGGLTVKGDLSGAMITLTDSDSSATALGKATVSGAGGITNNSKIFSDGNIGAVKAQRMDNSGIYLGTNDGPQVLTDSSPVFGAPLLQLTSLTLQEFSDSFVAAPQIGAVALGAVDTQSGGEEFGLAGDTIKSVKAALDGSKLAKLMIPLSQGNFILRVVM